jgi:hypothetical protein
MLTVSQLSKTMQEILVDKANHLAVETGFTQRERVLTGSSFVVGLMSGWQADPQSSLAGLSQVIGNVGTLISRQGVAQRLTDKGVLFIKRLLEDSLQVMVKAMPVGEGLLSRFTSVDVVDSSVIVLPNELADVWQGCGGNGDKARVSSLKLDVRSGHLKTLDISAGKQHDKQSIAHQQKAEVGSLVLEDLGYFKLDDLEAIGLQVPTG